MKTLNYGLAVGVVGLLLGSPLNAGYVEEVLRDGPVAYWRLGEADLDAPLVELTGNVSDGFFEPFGAGLEVGFPGAIVGDSNTSVQFATTVGFGCGDCGIGSVPVGGALDLGTYEDATISLEAWFQILPSVEESLPGSFFNRIFHYNNGEAGQYAFGIVGDNNSGFPGQRTVFGGVGSGLQDNEGDQGIIIAAESDSIPPTGDPVWHHFVATINQDDIALYLDGEELGGLEDSDPIFWQATQATIGGRVQSNGSFVHPFPGLIDELAIYNKLLSPERIRAHYDVGIGVAVENGDYNGDGVVNTADVDLQAVAMKTPTENLSTFDENGDGVVDGDDRIIWVQDHAKTWFGDANFDGAFSTDDLVAVFAAGQYETGQMAVWSEGDWSGDMVFDSGDLVAAFSDGGFELGPRPPAVAAVPEPTSCVLLLLGCLALVRGRK